MKLVIFGLTVSSSWGNGHATVWRGLANALHRQGHDIVFFERDVPYYAAHRDLTDPSWGKLVLYSSFEDILSLASLHVAEADATIITSYCPDAGAAADLILEAPGLRVFYDMDTPVTLAALQNGGAAYIGPRGLRDFDLVLSFTGGPALEALQSRLGARRVDTLYGSVDPATHRRVAPLEAFRADLSYLGTYAADRQATLEALFLEPARRAPARRFAIAGAQYPVDFPWSANIYFVRHLEPQRHAAFFCSSRLTLNVTRRAMADMGFCPSGRLFEAAACEVPIVSDHWTGLDTFFTPDSEILVARNGEDVLAALQLGDDELRRISRAARERVLFEHTAEHRAAQLVQALEHARQPETVGI